MPSPASDDMIRITDLAKRFGVTVPAVSNWIRRFGPESFLPFPTPDEITPHPRWHADRWPEIELWNDQRARLVRRGRRPQQRPTPEPTSHQVAVGPTVSMDAVLRAIAHVVTTYLPQNASDAATHDGDHESTHLIHQLRVLERFLSSTGVASAPNDTHSAPQFDDVHSTENPMLTITELANALGVTKASVQGWYNSTRLPVSFPRPVVDPPKVEGARRPKRLWSASQLPEARAWLLWYGAYKTRNLNIGIQNPPRAGEAPGEADPSDLEAAPRVREFLKEAPRAARSAARRGRIARDSVRRRIR